MSDKVEKEVRGVAPTYIGLLMGILTQIWTAWDEDDLELALRRACRLYYFTVDKLKVELSPDVESITKEMNHAYGLTGPDFFTTHLRRNRVARQIAAKNLPVLVDKIISLFDSRDYLELHKRAVATGKELGT